LGWRTDLAVRELEGADVTARDDHVLVRSPAIADFRWGNFMLLAQAPAPGEAAGWVRRFEAEFPGCNYVALGIDAARAQTDALDELTALGLIVERDAVLTTSRLRAPAKPAPAAAFRPVRSDDDWRQATELSVAADERPDSAAGLDYAARRMAAIRRACGTGRGAWFGAFRDGEMQAGLGIYDAGDGLARFQAVDTHSAHRRQGLATHLLHAAGRHAFARFGARTLVIAADPDYHAIDMYESLGFSVREQHVQLERVDAGA
jgi:ribosomal protein S18 acetylase RimI-like enzyme